MTFQMSTTAPPVTAHTSPDFSTASRTMSPPSSRPAYSAHRSRKPRLVYSLTQLDDGSFQHFQYFRDGGSSSTSSRMVTPHVPSIIQASISSTPSSGSATPRPANFAFASTSPFFAVYQRCTYTTMPRPAPRNMYTAKLTPEDLTREKERSEKAQEEAEAESFVKLGTGAKNIGPQPTRQSARVREKVAASTQQAHTQSTGDESDTKRTPQKRQARRSGGGDGTGAPSNGAAMTPSVRAIMLEQTPPNTGSPNASPEPEQRSARKTRRKPSSKSARKQGDRRVRVTAPNEELVPQQTTDAMSVDAHVADVEMADAANAIAVTAAKQSANAGSRSPGQDALVHPDEDGHARSESAETVSTASGASSSSASENTSPTPPMAASSPVLSFTAVSRQTGAPAATASPHLALESATKHAPLATAVSPATRGANTNENAAMATAVSPTPSRWSGTKHKRDDEGSAENADLPENAAADVEKNQVRSRSGRIVKKRRME